MSALELAPLFSDHAVLQRDQPVRVWGRAAPGTEVTVSFRGQSVHATADASRDWRVTLAPLPANSEGADLAVSASGATVVLRDVVVGDVWFCSGQSNMGRTVSQALNPEQEMAAANFPLIRQVGIRNTLSDEPAFSVATSGWQSATPETVRHFTAVGYFFAREIHQQIGVPVGIIHCSFGGTRIEAWMSRAALASDPAFAAIDAQWKRDNVIPYAERKATYDAALATWEKEEAAAKTAGEEQHAQFLKTHRRPSAPIGLQQGPSVLFNGMVHPLVPFALRGILWYQGESNAWAATEYRREFPALITAWRKHFGRDDLPFYWVQLAGYHTSHDWPALREAQTMALALPHTGQALAIDVGEAGDIHPRNKQEVGHRLALIARALTYGQKVAFAGPSLRSADREGEGYRLRFKDAEGGLVARGGTVHVLEIAGKDHVFHPATGRIEGETLFVTSPEVKEPVAVRYAWSSMPDANLYNAAGLPAVPFRTGYSVDWPETSWPVATPAEVQMNENRLKQARDYALTGGGSGMILRHGRVVMTWGDQTTLYDLKSSSKSIGVTALGLALQDGKVQLDDAAVKYQPALGVPPESNRATGWIEKITLRHLANQVAGFEKPGGYGRLLFAPGTKWFYSDAGPNWLAECLTLAYGRDLNDVMFERVFGPLGIKPDDIVWRENAYRPHEINGLKRREFGSGFSANVDAMARLGYLYLHEGRWRDRQIIPADFVRLVSHPAPQIAGLSEYDQRHGNASEHYSLLWWDNGDGTIPGLPRDAFWSSGLHNSHILVIPSLDIVAVRAGQSWKITSDEYLDVLKPFFEPIAASVRDFGRKSKAGSANTNPAHPPYPLSELIKRVVWAPVNTIVRRAPGGDTWPMTWGDDDALYTAYGDGNGFEPFVPEKLSLGFARVTGGPNDFQGVNLASVNGEFRGDGRSGRKASGMLMVNGVLYVLARNLDNAQLGWSRDHGATWTWADWKFTTSFGCPTFLNFGKNYAGARDNYVYLYSFDSDSAYEPADRMVLARVPKDRLTQHEAYEYFVSIDANGGATWSKDVARRGAVFTHPGACYRSGISYDAGLRRYLWCQILPYSKHPQGMRFQGGFGIYEAPEPWGPWKTVFYTPDWDTGPGETSSFPTKWMSADGRTLYLVFSGEDSFSVRKVTLE
ncbi:MAG TPA: sialate O-acetylesterase [Opitutaceae bacterium]|nr:sialate O-acetylesterase [Opitutaceae bacterium]